MNKSLNTSAAPLSPTSTLPSSRLFLYAVVCTASLTAINFGYVIANINVAGNVFNNCKHFLPANSSSGRLQGCFHVSTSWWGLVGAGVPLGGWIGSLAGGAVVRSFGLKRSILLLNIPMALGFLLMAFASNLGMLVVGRLLQGFACGLSGVAVPSYISEVTPGKLRGIFTNFFQLFLVSGVLVAEILSYSADLGRHLWRWRYGFGAGLIVCAIQVISAAIGNLPETPNELECRSLLQKACTLRQRLGFEAGDVTNLKDSASDSQIPKPDLAEQDSSNDSLWNLLRFKISKANKSMALGLLLHAGQQICGVNAVFFYSSLIFAGGQEQSSSFNDPPTLNPISLAAVNVLMTFVAIWLLNLSGRRPVVLTSAAGSSVCLILLAACMMTAPKLSVYPLLAFVVFFAVGLGPVPWMMMSEIFPPQWPLTMVAISTCVSANWIVNILVTGIFPSAAVLLKDHKELIFGFFGISCTAVFCGLYFLMPETRNRPANFI